LLNRLKEMGRITKAAGLEEIKHYLTVLPVWAKVEPHGFHERIVIAD